MKLKNSSIDQQRNIWSGYWKSPKDIHPENILNSNFTQKAYSSIKTFINKEDKLILEAGCGTGRFCTLLARDFPGSQIRGMDISQNSLDIATRLKKYVRVNNVNFEIGDLFHMPYYDDHFDIVFNEGVIEHYPLHSDHTYLDAIKEMSRITKRGGKIIVSVPNWYNFPHTLYKWIMATMGIKYMYGYEKSFKQSELRKIFLGLGLIDCEIGGFYPSHGFYRLSGNGLKKIFTLFGRISNRFESFFDDHFNGKFSKIFGIEILIKGKKI